MTYRLTQLCSAQKNRAWWSAGTLGLVLGSALALAGCSEPAAEYLTDLPPPPDLAGNDSGIVAPPGTDLPCEINKLLQTRCASCHGQPPKGSPLSLVNYDDLAAKSTKDNTKTVAERALIRMQDPASPMPPGAGVTVPQAELTAFQAWVTAKQPKTTCMVMPPKDPLNADPICTSMITWMGRPSATMQPGKTCIDCHTKSGKKGAPLFLIAGTVYPTGHEPDGCVGGVQPAPKGPIIVEITDKNGKVTKLTANSNGNFMHDPTAGAIALPYTAKVTYDGRERVMNAPQMSGDCNGCHTQAGSGYAPGRITLPY